MWDKSEYYTYKDGMLFLGWDGQREIGVRTERHAITIAGAGAGKGACVIVPNLKRWPHSVLVIDPKGEAAEITTNDRASMGQAVYVIDPFNSAKVDKRYRATYNPLDALNVKSPTVREDINAITDGIIMRHDPRHALWDNNAQIILSGLIAYTKLAAPSQEQNLTSVRRMLREGNIEDVARNMDLWSQCAGLPQAAARVILGEKGNEYVGNARENTAWLDSPSIQSALSSSSFSLYDLKRKKISVYLVLPVNYLGEHGRFLRLFVRCSIAAMARKMPGTGLRSNQCLFLLDEFYSLGRMDEISKAAGLMRGYGLQLWPILQDMGQLLTLYGREGAETFFANADLHQFFGNTDQLTLGFISSCLGVTDIDEVSAPPSAPITSSFSAGGAISSLSGMSRNSNMRITGGLLGAFISAGEGWGNSALQADYQDKMQEYQRELQKVGKPRLTPEQVAKIIQHKDDVVADGSINFLFGSNRLKLFLSPYFRNNVFRFTEKDSDDDILGVIVVIAFIVAVGYLVYLFFS